MPINQINPVQKSDSDSMDKVLKGLTIATELFKIPIGLETLKKTKLEQQALQQKSAGIKRPDEAINDHIVAASPSDITTDYRKPELASILNNADYNDTEGDENQGTVSQGPLGLASVLGAVGANDANYDSKQRFKSLQVFPQKIINNGVVTEVPSVNQEQKDKLIAQEGDRREKYTKESEPTETAVNHFANLKTQIQLATNDGDHAAMQSWARIMNPEINRMNDTAAQEAAEKKTLKELRGDFYDKYARGGRPDVLSPEQRKELFVSAQKAIADRLRSQSVTDEKYSKLAESDGFLPENILTDFSAKAYGGDGPQGLGELVAQVRQRPSNTGSSDKGGLIGMVKDAGNSIGGFLSNTFGGSNANAGKTPSKDESESQKLLKMAKERGAVRSKK